MNNGLLYGTDGLFEEVMDTTTRLLHKNRLVGYQLQDDFYDEKEDELFRARYYLPDLLENPDKSIDYDMMIKQQTKKSTPARARQNQTKSERELYEERMQRLAVENAFFNKIEDRVPTNKTPEIFNPFCDSAGVAHVEKQRVDAVPALAEERADVASDRQEPKADKSPHLNALADKYVEELDKTLPAGDKFKMTRESVLNLARNAYKKGFNDWGL